MSDIGSDLRRIARSSGLYAAAGIAQRGVSFLLLPVYTRYIEPADYGVLELLTAFSSILFACLMLGLPSAIIKCFHRDCESEADRASVLTTSILLDLPVLLVGGGLVFALADGAGRLLVGREAADLVRLIVADGLFATLLALVLASLRAQERAFSFSVLSFVQFTAAMLLNVVLVVGFGLGIRGVLWGNFLSNAVAFPLALLVTRNVSVLLFNKRLARALLHFGLLIVPAMLSGWVMDLSDRYVLRIYRALDEVAVYGVGYKIGMVLQLAVVWPFQLAWPAVSFSISHREGHKATYARTMTYLVLLLTAGVLGFSLLSRAVIPVLVGEGYREAYRVVPLVALAYAFNGVFYCVAPGVHITGKTKYLPVFSAMAAGLNLGCNFLFIPRFGLLGATWSTALAFLFLALATTVLSQRTYPVRYEYGRLARLVATGAAVYFVAVRLEPEGFGWSLGWQTLMVAVVFPLLLLMVGFLDSGERAALQGFLRRHVPFRSS